MAMSVCRSLDDVAKQIAEKEIFPQCEDRWLYLWASVRCESRGFFEVGHLSASSLLSIVVLHLLDPCWKVASTGISRAVMIPCDDPRSCRSFKARITIYKHRRDTALTRLQPAVIEVSRFLCIAFSWMRENLFSVPCTNTNEMCHSRWWFFSLLSASWDANV